MQTTKINVYVEKHKDGTYWGTTQNVPGVASSFGNTLEELKENLSQAFSDQLELAKELEQKWADNYNRYEFEYKLDLTGFFYLVSEIKISNLAKKANINPSLLRQYKTGKANASVQQLKKIENAVHQLGEELLSVCF